MRALRWTVTTLLALLLVAGGSEAAWTHLGALGTASSTSSSSSLVLTTGADAEAGNVVVLAVGKDNTGTGANGDYTECTGVTDSAGGNTWTKLREYTQTLGGAGLGATVCLYASKLINAIASGGTITVSFSASIVSKCATAREFFQGGIGVEAVETAASGGDNTEPGSLNLSVAYGEYLWVRATAIETRATTMTASNEFWTVFTQCNADTALAGTSMEASAEFRIFTGTSNPSDVGWSADDHANVYAAIREVTPSTHGTAVRKPTH